MCIHIRVRILHLHRNSFLSMPVLLSATESSFSKEQHDSLFAGSQLSDLFKRSKLLECQIPLIDCIQIASPSEANSNFKCLLQNSFSMDRYYQQLFMSLLKAIHLVLISQHNNEYMASQERTGKQVSNFQQQPLYLATLKQNRGNNLKQV